MKNMQSFKQLSLFDESSADLPVRSSLNTRLLDVAQHLALVEICCVVDADVVEELGKWWVVCQVEKEFFVEDGSLQKRQLLIRALIRDDNDAAFQYLWSYCSKIQLISPLELKEQILQEIIRMYDIYHHRQ